MLTRTELLTPSRRYQPAPHRWFQVAEREGDWSASDARMGGGASVSASSSRNSPLFSKCWVRFEISVALLSCRRFWRTLSDKLAWITALVCNALSSFRLRWNVRSIQVL